jgi:hypothetical protein
MAVIEKMAGIEGRGNRGYNRQMKGGRKFIFLCSTTTSTNAKTIKG